MAHFRPKREGIRTAAIFIAMALSLMAQAPDPVKIDGAARLLNFTGQISVLRSNYAWALHVGQVVNRQETIVTGSDGWGVFEVADGSKFEVFPNSRLVFRANMGDWKDLLEVFLGRVRVQIEHFGGLPNNNKVRTPSAVISVRGTIFSVEVEEQTETTTVVDEEGHVAVEHALKPGPAKLLNPGDSLRVSRNEALAKSMVDKSGLALRAFRAMADLAYQVAIDARNGTGSIGHTGPTAASTTSSGSAADKNNGTTTAPPPPAAAPPPPH